MSNIDWDRVAHNKRNVMQQMIVMNVTDEKFASSYGLYKEITRESLKHTFVVIKENFVNEDEAYYYSLLDDFYVINDARNALLTVEQLAKLMVIDEGLETYCKRQLGLVQYAAYKTKLKNTELIKQALALR